MGTVAGGGSGAIDEVLVLNGLILILNLWQCEVILRPKAVSVSTYAIHPIPIPIHPSFSADLPIPKSLEKSLLKINVELKQYSR